MEENKNIIHNNASLDEIEIFERKIYDLKNLISLGLSLSSNLDFESLVESLLYSCIGQMFLEKIAILLQVDIDESSFYIHMTKGYDQEFSGNVILRYDKSSLLKFFEENPAPHLIEELELSGKFREDLREISVLAPQMIVPMKSKNSLNGILVLGKKLTGDSFSEIEKEFLTDLAKFAAIAVENSRLYLMATLDRMTRLYIHHYFQERLLEETKRSQRTGAPLCVIMSDIDHFKGFNDTYGHQQGDTVLKEAAVIFKNMLRSTDIPSRYGGEEYAVILPDTELSDAIKIAERLRIAIGDHEFSGQKKALHVTISLGVAQYDPETDDGKDRLIQRADEALYAAKEKGRNRVMAHYGDIIDLKESDYGMSDE